MGQSTPDNATRLLELYREFEVAARELCPTNSSENVVDAVCDQTRALANKRAELTACRHMRNILSHNGKPGGEYVLQPSNSMVALLAEAVTALRKPPTAASILVPVTDVCYKTLDDPLWDTLEEMSRSSFSVIPILKAKKVVGAFSENTLLKYLISQGSVNVESSTTFAELGDLISLSGPRDDTFEFASRDTPVDELLERFQSSLKRKKRIVMVFVTEHGRPSEKLLGIITAWDLTKVA